MTAAAALAAVLTLTPHSAAEFDQWERDWFDRAQVALSPILLAEWRDMQVRHFTPQAAPVVHRGMGPNVTDWTGLVSAHFPASEVATALRVIGCESGGNPNAHNPSGASGLFQVMPFWADEFGVGRSDLFSAEVNVAVARQVWGRQGWGAWACY